ncbi:17761_t:CDS:2, partial [Rhizophagus irregularis]
VSGFLVHTGLTKSHLTRRNPNIIPCYSLTNGNYILVLRIIDIDFKKKYLQQSYNHLTWKLLLNHW